MQYTVEIFESADSSINEYLATIFVGVALLVSDEVALMYVQYCQIPLLPFPLPPVAFFLS